MSAFPGFINIPLGLYQGNYGLFDNILPSGIRTIGANTIGTQFSMYNQPAPSSSKKVGFPTGVQTDFIIDAAFPLYTVDGFGTKTYSGYNLCFEHKITASDSTIITMTQHITLRDGITGIVSSLLGSNVVSIGTGGNNLGTLTNYMTVRLLPDENDIYFCIGLLFKASGYVYEGVPLLWGEPCGISLDYIQNTLHYSTDFADLIEDPNEQDPGGESGEGGGDGGFNRDSDSNPVPGLPTINATDAGFIRLYYATAATLNLVAAEVYSANFFDWLKDFLMKPTDMICGIAIVPFVPSLGSIGTHSFGTFSFSTALTSISSQYKVINCGSIDIEKYYGSCFDYSPYTVLQIFLPFIGMRELDVDEVMGRSISVVYHCDCYTGACVAFITTPINNVDSVIAQYSGNILQQVPFGAGDFSQIVAATLSVATAVTGSIAAGGAAGAALAKEGATAGKIVSGAAAAAGETAPSITSSMSNVMSLKPRIEKASIAAGSSGQMSTLKPYLLRRIPRQSLPANYKELNGYPSNIAGPLSNFSGYAEIETIQLSGVNLTEPEITELLTILRGGVII